ncbi:MAG: AAA family ATPase [bacterium]|nr:AAA family ATPase [bacterium]
MVQVILPMGVCIDGPPGTGKTDLGRDRLVRRFGLIRHAGGDVQRALATKRGVSSQELERIAREDISIDWEIDSSAQGHAARHSNFLLDGRITAWLCRERLASYRHFFAIYLMCKDEVRYSRILKRERKNRPEITLDDVITETRQREEDLSVRMYCVHKYPLSALIEQGRYDLTIDTTTLDQYQVAAQAIRAIEVHFDKLKEKQPVKRVAVSV